MTELKNQNMYLDRARVLQVSLLSWFIKIGSFEEFLKFANVETDLAEDLPCF